MFNPADLPSTLPIFPLPGALLLPRARLPLHIFEPRFLAMLDDVLKSSHRLIGMVQPWPETHNTSALHSVGCAGRVTAFSETDNGRYMITLTGISRFTIKNMVEGFSPYQKSDVHWQGFERDLGPVEQDAEFDRSVFMELLQKYFVAQELKTEWQALKDADDEMLINSLSMLCPFDPEDRQALLEAKTLGDRRQTIATLMKLSLYGGRNEEVMQ